MYILDNYNVNYNRLLRDYQKNPLHIGINQYTEKSEKPFKEDLEYLYIELNIPRKIICEYFNCKPTKFKKWCKEYNIKKSYNSMRINKNISAYSKEVYDIIYNKDNLKNYIQNNNITTYYDLSLKLNISINSAYNFVNRHKLNYLFIHHCKSIPELELQNYVESLIPIIRNDRIILKPYELDIYIPSLNIGIEFMGIYWHNYNIFPEKYISDKIKREIAKNKNIKIIDIWEDDWYKNKNEIKNDIYNIIINK